MKKIALIFLTIIFLLGQNPVDAMFRKCRVVPLDFNKIIFTFNDEKNELTFNINGDPEINSVIRLIDRLNEHKDKKKTNLTFEKTNPEIIMKILKLQPKYEDDESDEYDEEIEEICSCLCLCFRVFKKKSLFNLKKLSINLENLGKEKFEKYLKKILWATSKFKNIEKITIKHGEEFYHKTSKVPSIIRELNENSVIIEILNKNNDRELFFPIPPKKREDSQLPITRKLELARQNSTSGEIERSRPQKPNPYERIFGEAVNHPLGPPEIRKSREFTFK